MTNFAFQNLFNRVRKIIFRFASLIFTYQLDLRTPGSIPSFASSRKQIRHSPKSLIYACPREQRKQRFVSRVLNFDFFKCLAVTDVFAIYKIIWVLPS